MFIYSNSLSQQHFSYHPIWILLAVWIQDKTWVTFVKNVVKKKKCTLRVKREWPFPANVIRTHISTTNMQSHVTHTLRHILTHTHTHTHNQWEGLVLFCAYAVGLRLPKSKFDPRGSWHRRRRIVGGSSGEEKERERMEKIERERKIGLLSTTRVQISYLHPGKPPLPHPLLLIHPSLGRRCCRRTPSHAKRAKSIEDATAR